ncbi:MAG: DoxX family protein [Acidimicrobiia bacterium]|nr:DoxX family protein [Acidimicrobiia bacterium]MDX2465767.1 DoxX family protein [Acidimicrobiia bacterium]
MNAALWIVQIVLAMMMLMAGAMKVMKSKDELHEKMGWVEDFSENTIKAIGGLEVLGAIGLILPAVTGIAPVLVPLAAVGLAITMVGAVAVHVRRSEMASVAITVMLLAMAVFVAWGRFGDYAF